MCLAIPGVVKSMKDGIGVIDYGGVSHQADLTLTPEAQVGSRVLVHAGFTIAVLTDEDGDARMKLAEEMMRYE